jgi:hypothetical protein
MVRPLPEIPLKERLEAAQTLVLGGVRKLVDNEPPLPPTVRPDDNAVTEGQPGGERRDQARGLGGSPESRMLGNGNLIDAKEADAGWVGYSNELRIRDLIGCEDNAMCQDVRLLFLRPDAGQR